MNEFSDTKHTMTRWEKFKTHYPLYTGVIGLVADTITILGAIGVAQILPHVSSTTITSPTFESLLLITALVGLYSLTMIVWFLFRWKRAKQEIKTFGLDELYQDSMGSTSLFNVMFALIPVFGPFNGMLSLRSVRLIFWLAVFVSLFPTTLWLFLLTTQALISCGSGLLGSFLLSQYATFFALVLDRFFVSDEL